MLFLFYWKFLITLFTANSCLYIYARNSFQSIPPDGRNRSKNVENVLADFILSFFFVFIFTKGYQNKGIMEGVRYGVYIALFINFMVAVAQNVLYPIPYTLALQWFIYGSIQMVLLQHLFINRQK